MNQPNFATTFPKILVLAVAIVAVSGDAHSAQQQTEKKPGLNIQPDQSAAGVDEREFEKFFDDLLPGQLQKYHIPGATISVVKDSATVFAKGYGYARLEPKTPVNPESSLFRIASLTKLFTWTAVMQLVEQGQLDLDADVNTYLSAFQIPKGFGKPVTLRHLMTHTAGFEDRGLIGTLAREPKDFVTLEHYLAHNIPARVRPPGVVSAYSNYGGALAGYIVATVSGSRYEDYIQQKIFAPLEMQHATANQLPSAFDQTNLAYAYHYRDNEYQQVPFALLIPTPEGSISASASSMSRFMLAHVDEEGSIAGKLFVRPATVRQMQQQLFTHHPRLVGWAHGFQEKRINGFRLLQHGGRLGEFVSLLVLVPERNIGFFVSYNSQGGSVASRELRQSFFDQFLPSAKQPGSAEPKQARSITLGHVDGFYAPCRSSQTTIAKIGLLVQASPLRKIDDSSLSFLNQTWTGQEPDVLKSDNADNELMALRENDSGQVEYVFIGTSAWRRLHWYEAPGFQLIVLGSCLLLFASTIVYWPIAFVIRLFGRRNREGALGNVATARWMAGGCSIINLLFVIAIATILGGDTSFLEYGVPTYLRLLLCVPFFALALAAGVVVFSLRSFKAQGWGRFDRIHYACVAMACVTFIWFLHFWNLLGWRF